MYPTKNPLRVFLDTAVLASAEWDTAFVCLRPRTPLLFYTMYVYTVYLFTQGRGGGELNQREGYKGNSSQSWVENTIMAQCISSL
jgi:hypothetical protein